MLKNVGFIVRTSLGRIFVALALCFAATVYLSFMAFPHGISHTGNVSKAFFHVLFAMFLWSFAKCSLAEPGVVPPYWGFHVGDSEVKRKRYCLLCHVFKPDRCHHCSICNRCVLNMDHHCPWINNCIGFFNRKFFILMLAYAIISGYFVLFSQCERFYFILKTMAELRRFTNPDLAFLVFFAVLLLICMILTKFFALHLNLVLKNSTTIESLENSYTSRFNVSPYWNFMQVFGREMTLWPFPFYGQSGKPLGDGISWPSVGFQENENEGNLESEPNQRESTVKQVQSFSKTGIWPVESPAPIDTQNRVQADDDTDTSFIRANNSLG